MSMPTEIKIYISIFAGLVLCLILIKGFGKNQQQQADDTVFSPVSNSMAISNDTLGSFTIYDANGNSLNVRSVAGMFWTVESSKPIRIRLKDGYLESAGYSIALGTDTLIYPKAALEQFDFCIAERDAIDKYREQGFKVIAEWSHTRQCSVMVQWSKTDGDSIISYFVSNPDNYSQGIKQTKP